MVTLQSEVELDSYKGHIKQLLGSKHFETDMEMKYTVSTY